MDNKGEFNTFGNFITLLKDKVSREEPNQVKQKCLDLCKQYLSGIWTELTVNDIEVKQLTGGMSNQVFHCFIPGLLKKNETEPAEVAIRFYNEMAHIRISESPRFEETIVWLWASERGLCAKVFGVFPNGQIQKYYQHRTLVDNDLYNQDIRDQLAIKLAHFHAMEPPLPKNKDFVQKFCKRNIEIYLQIKDQKSEVFEKYNCKTLLDCDLKAELDWISDRLKTFDSPIVFSHNDFRPPNVMLSEGQIVLSDLEGSDYYYRGLDFASVFSTFIKTEEKTIVFKDESIVKAFIERYVEENEKIFGKQYSVDKNNSVEHIFGKTKLFSLVWSHVLISSLIINEKLFKIPIEEEMCMKVSNNLIEKYLATKKLMFGDEQD